MKTLRLKKKQEPGQCAAMRCTQETEIIVKALGYLCEKHKQAAADADEILGPTPWGGSKSENNKAREELGREPEGKSKNKKEPSPAPPRKGVSLVKPTLDPASAAIEEDLTKEGLDEAWQQAVQAEIAEVREDLATLADEDFVLEDQDDIELGASELQKTKKRYNELKERRATVNRFVKKKLEGISTLLKERERLEAAWKGKILQAQRATAEEQERLVEEARKSRDHSALVAASETEFVAEGVSIRNHWVFEVEDASKIPRAYLKPDEKKIGEVVRQLKGDTSIPGVRVWNEPIVASKSA